jgi:Zn-dependent M16 (insulinase) family peptidase
MDVAEKLAWMDEAYLGKYEAIGLDSEIKLQKPFEKPIEVTHKYSISSTESEENNTYLSYNTVIETALDEKLYLAFDILDYALVSAPGAPLKQALIDAGIGSEITGGYDSGTLQPTFSVIAKNTNPQEKEHFLAVIRETLEGLVKNGLNKKSLLAGINSSEFRYREADFGHFPKGLLYGIQCLDSWLYDDMRPFLHLEALDTYRFLKEQVETDYFEQLIQKYLLNNKHASVVIIEPEKGLNAKNEAALEKKLAEYKAGLSEDEIRKLIADTKHLKEYQETPSPKEDLEKIPMLARSDMKKEAAPFYNTELSVKGIPVVHHDIYSNGIIYLTMLFDIAHVPAEDIPYLGVLKAVLGYVDTKNYSYADFANEVNIHTGGISSTIGVYPSVKDKDDYQVKFEVRTKALYDKLPEAATLMKEMLFTSNIDDEKRLYEIIAELKSRLQVSISSAGHSVASTRAMTYFSKAAAYKDTITFYETLCDLEAHFDERKEALTAKLKEMVSSIFTKEHLLVSVTCEKDGLSIVETELEKFIPMLYETSGEEKQAEIVPVRKNEGFMDASQVLYVARAGNFRAHGFDYHGALRILKVIMEYDYLWINIRVKGGAYGCMNGYMKNGDTYFVSYRDPNLEKTNEIYDGIPAYIEQFTADERDMTKYIIGTISDMDVPMNPSTKGDRSMAAYLQNISYEEIQKERDQVIGATQEDIRGLRDMIASVLAENNLCVVGNEETLQASEGMFGEVKHLNESER